MGSARGTALTRTSTQVERPSGSSLHDQPSPLDPLLKLQQTVGNQAVLRLLRAGHAQARFRHSSGATPTQGGCAAPRARSRPPLTLQKKCARCATGATCSECGDEEKLHRKDENQSAPVDQYAPKLPTGTSANPSEDRPQHSVHLEQAAINSAPSAAGATCTECGEEEKPDRAKAPDVGERTDILGTARCDLDQRKMVWQIHKQKIPKCMWKCAEAHELAHVKYGKGECSKVSAAYTKVKQLSAEADRVRAALEKNPTKVNAAKAEDVTKKLTTANEGLRKALDAYKKWLEATCRDDEKKAYQADIDACTGPKVEKQCADLKETDRYKKLMKDAEVLKKNPPNCK